MNEELVNYIENYVFPLYQNNDKSHQLWHIEGVIERSLDIARSLDVDLDMVYVIAAFHDIGHHVDAKNHEIESAKIFKRDSKMCSFFNAEKLTIIKEAIEDHRASLKSHHRSIYGKIIATADKFTSVEDVIKSVHLYTLEYFWDATWEEQREETYQYLNKKYGSGGYATVPLNYKPYDEFLKEIRTLLQEKNKINRIIKVMDEILRRSSGG